MEGTDKYKPEEKGNTIFSPEVGGFINESDILYYKGMGQRCDEIQEIMGRTPTWLRKWGMILLAAVTVGFLCLVWFLKVPETVDVEIHTRGLCSDVPVVASQPGTVVKVNVSNGCRVNKGDTALIISEGGEENVILSPLSGTVGFTAPIMRGAMITVGTALCYICGSSSTDSSPLYGYLPAKDAAKVFPGMEVYLGNGDRGVVKSISPVAHDSGEYYFDLSMPSGESGGELLGELTGKIRISEERLVSKLWRSLRKR